jgi:hypothetical protein
MVNGELSQEGRVRFFLAPGFGPCSSPYCPQLKLNQFTVVRFSACSAVIRAKNFGRATRQRYCHVMSRNLDLTVRIKYSLHGKMTVTFKSFEIIRLKKSRLKILAATNGERG